MGYLRNYRSNALPLQTHLIHINAQHSLIHSQALIVQPKKKKKDINKIAEEIQVICTKEPARKE